jgi:tripartite-type tricarboxylate transporter receptor subunit TctC
MGRTVRVLILILGLLSLDRAALGQTYPDRTIKIVVGSAAGGGLDVLCRAVAHGLNLHWGKPVVVENRPGASGLIAAEAVANAEPDGYTLLGVTDQIYLANRFAFKKLPYDPDKLANIGIIARADQLVVVNTDVPVSSMRELIDLQRAKPGMLTYGHWGDGSPPQLLYETLNKDAGIDLLGVPYKGVSPVLLALGSNEVQLSVVSAGGAAPLLTAGRVRVLAIAGSKRTGNHPDVPTTAEVGYPGLRASIWFGLAAPPATPPQVVEQLGAQIRTIVRDPEFVRRYIDSQGWQLVASTPGEMDDTIRTELPTIRLLTTNAGLKAQQ